MHFDEQELYELGFSHYGSGLYPQAEELFLLLCSKNPIHYLNWYSLGSSQFMQNEYEKACQSLSIAHSLNASHTETKILLAEAFLQLNMIQDAKNILDLIEKRKDLSPHLEKKCEWLQFRLNECAI